eukprot:5076078-Alexandrium_andersonii.AAC.1
MLMTEICPHRHHPMVLTVVTVLVRRPRWAQTRSPEVSRGPFCAVVRAERGYGNENLLGASWGLVFAQLFPLGVEVVLIMSASAEGRD